MGVKNLHYNLIKERSVAGTLFQNQSFSVFFKVPDFKPLCRFLIC